VNSRWARVARGASAAGFATFVAAFSHVIGGGSAPTVFGMAASLVIATMLCTILTAAAPSLWRLATSVAVSQLLFHFLFSGLGTPVAAHHDMSAMASMPTPAQHQHADSAMWLAHVAAGVVTLVALRYAERALRSVARTAALLFARLVELVFAAPGHLARRVAPSAWPDAVTATSVLLSSMRYRGPPRAPRTA